MHKYMYKYVYMHTHVYICMYVKLYTYVSVLVHVAYLTLSVHSYVYVQKASPWRPGFVWFVKSSHSSYFCLPA